MMSKAYNQEETYTAISLTEVPVGEYDGCTFKHCDWAEGSLAGYVFVDCTFQDCDLSLVKLHDTALRGVVFKSCKLQGLHFDHAHTFLFEVSFQHCKLNLSSFYQRVLKKTKFAECQLEEVDFAAADLSQAVFSECNLNGASFDNTNLEKADFSTAYGYTIDPEQNRVKKAKFSRMGLEGLLTKYDIQVKN
ncbi:MAG: pentapeptide repeat-containing protein [Bacteroidota bacterium]